MQVQQIPRDVAFYDHRGKRISLLPKGSEARKQAEAVLALREQGVTFQEMHEKTGLSLSTLRRALNRLHLTLAVESGDFDKELRRLVPAQRESGMNVHPSRRKAS